MNFVMKTLVFVCLASVALLAPSGCSRKTFSGSKLTDLNYDQVTLGMTKGQVETILGQPQSAKEEDKLIYKRTTYRYENKEKFAVITFKNDEVDSKDTNLGREP